VTTYEGAGDLWADEPPLTMSVTHCNDGVVVQARGEVDLATRRAFERRIRWACEQGGDAWLDLMDVTFLDPQGIRLLARLQTEFGGLRIASASAAVRRSAEIVELIDGAGTGPVLDSGAEPECDAASR
jgi:anti-anti-sigma factor